jgi:hypothetical protein
MKKGRFRKIGCIFTFVLLGLVMILVVASGISALVNRNLPRHSNVVERLDELEKVRIAEFYHLQQTLGDQVWPGWGEATAPIIVYNEQYAFLIGYEDPPPGWIKMPQNEARGGPWEPVPGDSYHGQTYYRQQLTEPGVSPEGFTVLVGDRWVTSFQTMEYMEVSFYAGLRDELPPLVRDVFPYRLMLNQLIADSDAYITVLAHEAFHSYEAMTNREAFSLAEEAMQLESEYPWGDELLHESWREEVDLLIRAAKQEDPVQAKELGRQFLEQRDERRASLNLSPALVEFERQREWLEGLAKYVELSIGRAAATTPGYQWLSEMDADPRFDQYHSLERFWMRQLEQGKNIVSEGDVWFYYSGFAEAVVLDKIAPDWKENTIPGETALEDMIRLAVAQH